MRFLKKLLGSIHYTILIAVTYFGQNQVCFAEQTFLFMAPTTNLDKRYQYDKELLRLALTLTADEYPEEFIVTPSSSVLENSNEKLNVKRTEALAKQGFYENFFFKFSARDDLMEDLLAIEFPVDRGIVSYRVSFVSKENKSILQNVTKVKDMSKMTTLQGIGWLDSDILAMNGMPVFNISVYPKMFEMISNNRAELLFRGINEWYSEQRLFKIKNTNLAIDENIALYYPMPRFLFTSKDNVKNAKRVEKGLKIAYETGQLQALWHQFYAPSIKASQLSQRRLITLNNPYIKSIDKQYEQYNISMAEIMAIEKSH